MNYRKQDCKGSARGEQVKTLPYQDKQCRWGRGGCGTGGEEGGLRMGWSWMVKGAHSC